MGRGGARAGAAIALCTLITTFPAGAPAEQASRPTSAAAGGIHTGGYHACALLAGGGVRCWGFNGDGQLGYGNTKTIGDDETPGSVEPVNLGGGRTARAIGAGTGHTCALRDDGKVLCWGFGGDGRLGYGNTDSVGDNETPGSVQPVDLGAGRTATAISAGAAHTCAVLDGGGVRCWGYNGDGELGYGNTDSIGDNESPGTVAPVNLGVGRTAMAITAGPHHTCALLDDASVRCWGHGGTGKLGVGYGFEDNIGDDEAPGSVEPVKLGRKAIAITAGYRHTCALLEDGNVRCWGYGISGRLGYGNTANVGIHETPDTVGPVDLGSGRTATAISAGRDHSCAVLHDESVRCWGYGGDGRLGYGNQNNIGDSEAPGSAGPVDLGPGRRAMAISAGDAHTCARLDDGSMRCWGYGGSGRLGYCSENSIGDDETPGAVGPVDLEAPGTRCPGPGVPPGGPGWADPPNGSGEGAAPVLRGGDARGDGRSVDPALESDARRARALRRCLTLAGRKPRRQKSRARGACLKRYGRTPGRVSGLQARAISGTEVLLSFTAPGTDGSSPPAARAYLVKQSLRPIRNARGFARAQTLCQGSCRFSLARVGETITLTVTDLQPHSTYHYVVAARDNVSRRLGPRSATVSVTTP